MISRMHSMAFYVIILIIKINLILGVIYIYSGELYWRYTKAYGMESLPRLTFLWGLPGKRLRLVKKLILK